VASIYLEGCICVSSGEAGGVKRAGGYVESKTGACGDLVVIDWMGVQEVFVADAPAQHSGKLSKQASNKCLSS